METVSILEQKGKKIKAFIPGGALPTAQKSIRDKILFWIYIHLSPDRLFYKSIQSMGGFIDTTDINKQKFIMNGFRHDTRNASKYFKNVMLIKKKLEAPILFIAGENDPITKGYNSRYKEWEIFSNNVILSVIKNGGHYFHKEYASHTAQILIDKIENL